MNKYFIKIIVLLFIFFNMIIVNGVQIFKIPNPPDTIYPINDYEGILNIDQINQLNNKLLKYYKQYSTEILIAIINNSYGEDLNLLAAKWGNKWKIGKKNNGIIILLSIKENKISIQNGYRIEPYITDFLTRKILDKIRPFLVKKLYFKSLNIIIDDINQILKNKQYKYNNKLTNKHHQHHYYTNTWYRYIFLSILLLLFFCRKSQQFTNMFCNPLLLELFLEPFFFKKQIKSKYEKEDNFDGFGEGEEGGGNFGGGGSEINW
ncbi:TPM domain-containing protein [Blattabacterium cuenoti]|uniref:TPM domain-containing protein n=1 Tax=Blattabacterium cuenoti TaxID=1653831 RepID=UPI00163B8933|nr:TPM domain-containing protein [Blattabacterium cuenoti]